MPPLLEQAKQRRIALGLKQQDMAQRIGMSRQQYQRMESKGNPRLDTLELMAKGLRSELMLIPQDKVLAVKALLEGGDKQHTHPATTDSASLEDLWEGLLPEDEE